MTNKDKFSKFTDIKQFRGIVQNIIRIASFKGYDDVGEPILEEPKLGSLPVLTFEYTTKIHGTNAGVSLDEDGNVFAMSRSRVITPGNDNAGFAAFVEKNKDWFKDILDFLFAKYKDKKVFLYGEWCGKGIQNNVAITKVDKRFVLFALKLQEKQVDEFEPEAYYVKLPQDISAPERDIYNIREIGVNTITIDFNKPEIAQNQLIKIVDEVEAECPVGKYFGVEGIGEGIVVAYYNDANVREHIFKVKGEKHAAKSGGKVKTLKPVDEKEIQRYRDFANSVCKEWRLDQMYNEVFDTLNGGKGDIKKTGDFIRAVVNDVMKEEMDLITKEDFNIKSLNSLIAKISKGYLFSRLDKEAGL
jgi:hypothetical protein